jgi:hypothetical protein
LVELPAGTHVTVNFQRGGKVSVATLTLADRIPAAAN